MESYRNKMGNRNMPTNNSRPGCLRPIMTTMASDCAGDCKDNNPHMKHFKLGMAYVPMQEWGELYDLETSHCQGTIFPNLNYIFCGSRGKL